MSFKNSPTRQSARQRGPAVPKSDAVPFDLAPFVPSGVEFDFYDNSEGTTNIPHRILEWIVKVSETKLELRILLCMVRLSLGYQDYVCCGSQSYIGNWTGLQVPNVRRAIKALMEKGLVVQVSKGTLEHGWGHYEVPIVKAYLQFIQTRGKPNSGEPSTGAKTDSDQNDPSSNQSEISDQNNPSTEIKLIPNKEVLKKERNQSLSQNENAEIPKTISDYLSSVRPHKKREGEKKHFLILKKDFSLEEISDCLDRLMGYGLPGNGERCHSPMAYLSVAMDEVLAIVQAEESKMKKFDVERQQRAEQERKDREEQAAEDTEFQRKTIEFEKAFPSLEAERSYLREFSSQYPALSVGGPALRNLAIIDWSLKEENRIPKSPQSFNQGLSSLGSVFKTMGV